MNAAIARANAKQGHGLNLLLVALLLVAVPCCAQELGMEAMDNLLGSDEEDFIEALGLDETAAPDFEGLVDSHLSYLRDWQYVRPTRSRDRNESAEYRWADTRSGVVPLSDLPVTALIRVPEAATYRLYLRHDVTRREQSHVGSPGGSSGSGWEVSSAGGLPCMPGTIVRKSGRRMPPDMIVRTASSTLQLSSTRSRRLRICR
jgi:hypothetical protein